MCPNQGLQLATLESQKEGQRPKWRWMEWPGNKVVVMGREGKGSRNRWMDYTGTKPPVVVVSGTKSLNNGRWCATLLSQTKAGQQWTE